MFMYVLQDDFLEDKVRERPTICAKGHSSGQRVTKHVFVME